MTLDAELNQSQEERLDEVIAAYLRDAEAGRNPDQAEILARHPELAGELQSFFAGQEHIGRLAAPLRQVVEAAPDAGITGTLGDFRIVREVGRGGMGIVYEAEQISLRRRVALKVLPFAATMDARHLQRFHNEAQAAACLHHTNIVPVFSVGSERGVHFYAMQFIDGQPLSEIIRQMRRLEKKEPLTGQDGTVAYRPSPGEAASTPLAAEMTPLTREGRRNCDYYRKVAELGIQAAEALDHAHQLGIVHRDIKPGNLMLDGTGRVWVTDFGLAHVQHSEASLTMTGQALGTPRYMSPEQAMAKRVPIDHRTDVYSLGVTLYELLTLRPAFTSEERHELLQQIAFEEPAKPRRLEHAIPAELETIVLMAMEKRPQDRYASIQELADDLRHWLGDRPIRARRPSIVQRASKWGRRHKSLVAAAGFSLFLALILLLISNLVIWYEHEKTKEALYKAQLHEQEVRDQIANNAALRNESESKLQRLLEGTDRILTLLEEPFPKEGTEAARIYMAVSEQVMKVYQDVLPIRAISPTVRGEMVCAYVRLGNLYAMHNKFPEANQAYLWAVCYANPGLQTDDGSKRGDLYLFTSDPMLSDQSIVVEPLFAEVPERPAVEKAYLRALAHWRDTSPAELSGLLDYRIAVQAAAGRLRDPLVRIRVWERTLEDLPTRRNVAHFLTVSLNTAADCWHAGNQDEAKAIFHRSLRSIDKAIHDPLFTVSFASKPLVIRGQAPLPLVWGADRSLEIVSNDIMMPNEIMVPNEQPRVAQLGGLPKLLFWIGGDLYDLNMPTDAETAIRDGLLLYKQQSVASKTLVCDWVKNCEPLLEKEGRLTALLSGQEQPANNAERLGLAWILQYSQMRYTAATRYYRDAFANEPMLNGDQPSYHRSNAACAAALAGYGEGKDAAALDDRSRYDLRRQALDWLRAESQAWHKLLAKEPEKACSVARWQVQQCDWSPTFGFIVPLLVRARREWILNERFPANSPKALDKLPEAEREEWQKTWNEAIRVRQRALAGLAAGSSARP